MKKESLFISEICLMLKTLFLQISLMNFYFQVRLEYFANINLHLL